MSTAIELTKHVVFESGLQATDLTMNYEFGFMQVQNGHVSADALHIVGFAAPFARHGGYDTDSSFVQPITELNDVPAAFQRPRFQAKGVGPRVFNSCEAVSSLPEVPERVGLYVFSVNPEELLDYRSTQGNAMTQIFRHARRIMRSRVTSLDSTIEAVHAKYGEHKAVLLDIPPVAEARMSRVKRIQPPKDIPPRFLLIRSGDITLEKIGSAASLG